MSVAGSLVASERLNTPLHFFTRYAEWAAGCYGWAVVGQVVQPDAVRSPIRNWLLGEVVCALLAKPLHVGHVRSSS